MCYLLSLCFTGFLKHGILPDFLLSVLLVPVMNEKTGKISTVDNYTQGVSAHLHFHVSNGYNLKYQMLNKHIIHFGTGQVDPTQKYILFIFLFT